LNLKIRASLINKKISFNMLTITSYIVLLFGALGFTLAFYLGLVKIVKLI